MNAPSPTFTNPEELAGLSASTSALRGEIGEIRSMVRQLLTRPSIVDGTEPAAPPVPEELQEYYTKLIQNDVSEEIARRVIAQANDRLRDWRTKLDARLPGDPNGSDDHKHVLARKSALAKLIPAAMLECIERMLPPVTPIQLDEAGGVKFVALVGPTGVGKTTTIAKLAAHFKLREKKRVGLITIDTYRIAAVDQLKAYAEILNVPLEIVMSPAEMAAAVQRMNDFDLVLIDTSGRSQKDSDRIGDLRSFLDAVRDVSTENLAGGLDGSLETLLVLSCTSHPEQLADVVERFAPLGADRVIFSKLDEALGVGVILNVTSRLKVQLSYLTMGQDVPDDIEVGHRRRIAEMVLNTGSPTGACGRAIGRSSPLVDHVA